MGSPCRERERRNPFRRQAEVVVRVLPYVARRDEFALKGGTASSCAICPVCRWTSISLTYRRPEPALTTEIADRLYCMYGRPR